MGNANGGSGNDLFRKGGRPQGYGGGQDMAGADAMPPPPMGNSPIPFNSAPGSLNGNNPILGASNGGFLDSVLSAPNPGMGSKSIDPNTNPGVSFGNAIDGPAAGVRNSPDNPLLAPTSNPIPPPVMGGQLGVDGNAGSSSLAAGVRPGMRPGMRPNAQADNPQFNSSGATSGRRGGRGNRRGRLNMF